MLRTHICADIDSASLGNTVTLCGWVHRRRDHGGLIFIDLRDHSSLVQVVCDPSNAKCFDIAQTLRQEYVIQVTGKIESRPEGTKNPDLKSGDVELHVTELVLLNSAAPLPFNMDEHQQLGEETRLKYRFLDLRRTAMAEKIKCRARITHYLHNFLHDHEFIHIETPVLTKSTPEGARDYLVPSRTHKGSFFALPQSPQIFKQLLMVSGFDKYYQIVKCFRDEDLRADRQPEFTQLDIEMAFIDEKDIQALMENMLRGLFKAVLNVDLTNPFKRMTYADAMDQYGSDKPDLRIPLSLVEVSDLLADVDFKVFSSPAKDPAARVAALRLPKGTELTRKKIDEYTQFVSTYGAKGLAYIKVNDLSQGSEGLASPILKFLPDDIVQSILSRVSAQTGDIIFFGADTKETVNAALGALRVQLGADFNLYTSAWEPLWVTDFPMFEYTSDKKLTAIHHPFTAPSVSTEALKINPEAALSRAYDIVLNGFEIGGGSIRIHDQAMQQVIFDILDISPSEAKEKFGHLLDALSFGAPPHGGIAFGIDRVAMLMTESDSIRDVIAFPKTQSAACPLTQAPSPVDFKQLRELGIQTTVRKT